ncbi:MAG TPA: thiamine phosphate synthase [Terricaulis sp.]|nr:thiamine phosphate synthase [Terricaulis sp.]
MGAGALLAAEARRLNRAAGAPALPALFFFTDPKRTPDPLAIARALPRGAGLVYRHFGAPERGRMARALARACRQRGLILLIAADPELAARVGAAGVHWPERLLPAQREAAHGALVTAAAHNAAALARARAYGADAAVLSPVFPTESASGHAPLGLFRASQLARAAGLPVLALGGINAGNARLLAGRGFAGLVSVGALSGF